MKEQVKKVFANIAYTGHMAAIGVTHNTRIQVLSIDETIRRIKEQNLSMIRFGDGEITLIRGRSLAFQEGSRQLAEDLRTALQARDNGLIITVPDIFNGLDLYKPASQEFWKDHLLFCRKIYYENCSPDIEYGTTSISRCYITLQDQSRCREWFNAIKEIWAGKDVTVVEGAGSHTGVTNDLLDTAASVERILCPPRKAYDSYAEILETCCRIDKNRLVLLAVGPTAKPLGLVLFRNGYRVLDIGNLDTEYEWFLAGAQDKVKIAKQQVLTEEDNRKEGYTQYLSEVVQRIGC